MAAPPILTDTEVIDRARAAKAAEQAAACEQLEMALAWALLHPCPVDEEPAQWGEMLLHEEGITSLAGPGAPWVAEFAPDDFGAALQLTRDQAKTLIGDALELAFRLPRLWDLLREGHVPAWRARHVAQRTIDLSLEAALFADRLIAATPDRINQVNVARLVQEARLFFDPDRAVDDEAKALAKRGVWLRRDTSPASSDIHMTLDAADAELLEATITRIAADLADLGDSDDLDIRRARAAGILADPHYALDLMSGREEAVPTRTARNGDVTLFVHLGLAEISALSGQVGATVVERVGAVTTQLLREWLARYTEAGARVLVRPVVDLSAEWAVDRHDPPEAMREAVLLRDSQCVFPSCRRDSRFCDLDHIVEYVDADDGGPPGQTHPGNLAPLCRTHHRVKTHSPWFYKRLDDGSYVWTSPTGHQHTVVPLSRRPAHCA